MSDKTTGESEQAPEKYETTLTHNSAGVFEIVLPEEITAYHGFEHKDRIGYGFVQDGQTLRLRGELEPDVDSPKVQSITVRGGGQSTIRLPSMVCHEQGFSEAIADGEDVTVTVESPGRGIIELVFRPPITPIQVPTNDLDYRVRSLVGNEAGEEMKWKSYRIFFGTSDTNRYILDKMDHAVFQLAFANGKLGLSMAFSRDEEGRSKKNASRISLNRGSDQYYVTVPKQFVDLLGWEDRKLSLYGQDDGIAAIPAE